MNPDLTPELTGAQFEAKFAQVKNLKSMSTQSKPPLGNKPGSQRESSAELDRLKGEVATLKARLASAPAKPAAPATLTATARREAAKAASTLSGATADKFSDSMLFQAATHRSSPESDKAIAKAELEKRGFSISPEGILSQSFRK